jgi:flavin reductase (DIM6/NTAB) family NADH-FMN oxidoreductase RutF
MNIRQGDVGKMKVEANKRNALGTMPKLAVTVRDKDGRDNALIVGYCGHCSYDPPMIMVGLVPSRFSYHMIKENGSFVAHLLDESQADLYECCGSESGKDGDKLKVHNVNLIDADIVNAAIMKDCPVAIECTVVDSIMTGSHEMFVGKIEKVHVEEGATDDNNCVDLSKLNII